MVGAVPLDALVVAHLEPVARSALETVSAVPCGALTLERAVRVCAPRVCVAGSRSRCVAPSADGALVHVRAARFAVALVAHGADAVVGAVDHVAAGGLGQARVRAGGTFVVELACVAIPLEARPARTLVAAGLVDAGGVGMALRRRCVRALVHVLGTIRPAPPRGARADAGVEARVLAETVHARVRRAVVHVRALRNAVARQPIVAVALEAPGYVGAVGVGPAHCLRLRGAALVHVVLTAAPRPPVGTAAHIVRWRGVSCVVRACAAMQAWWRRHGAVVHSINATTAAVAREAVAALTPEASGRVRADGVRRASLLGGLIAALVDVVANEAAARVALVARAREAARRVLTAGVLSALVVPCLALVDVDADVAITRHVHEPDPTARESKTVGGTTMAGGYGVRARARRARWCVRARGASPCGARARVAARQR